MCGNAKIMCVVCVCVGVRGNANGMCGMGGGGGGGVVGNCGYIEHKTMLLMLKRMRWWSIYDNLCVDSTESDIPICMYIIIIESDG